MIPLYSLPLNRDTLLYRLGNPNFNINEEKASYKTQDAIMEVIYYNDTTQTDSIFGAIEKTETDYIVLFDSSPVNDFLQKNGFINIGGCEGYVVYQTP